METPTRAAALYEKTFIAFKKESEINPMLDFKLFCSLMHVNYTGIMTWINDQGYEINEGQKCIQLEPATSPLEPVGFVQFKPSRQKTMHGNMLSNVCVKLPTGISVTVQSASVDEILDLVERFNLRIRKEA